ncbi:MAG TPA: maleylpyruvate isomerase family mycothiol-dependent enzyme [Pseudonocardiaceae bacterium]|jgi:uncharacterized protein (TIGR03083 family)|nr:maleylpyruvate isomerase family mycothiol-dependent enzyme [Pseudonocardiaceae bacterium]
MIDTLTDTEYRAMIAEHRTELAGVLADLPAGRWDAPTLCDGWRVREVVAHMTMPFRMAVPRFVWEMAKARGNFNRAADRIARRDTARLTADDLTACLLDNAHHPWRPPGGGYAGALVHDLVHTLDITIPLRIDRPLPADRLAVLTRLEPRGVKFFGVDLSDVRLRADDVDWTFGTGEPLCGRAQDLVLVVCGRRLPAGRLRGAASARFSIP